MSSRFRLNSWVLPALLLVSLIMEFISPSRVWTMIIIGLGGALILGFFWARGLARGLSLKREMRYGWAQVGDRLEERFTLTNHSVFPAIWVEIDDHSTMPDYHASLATGLGSNSESQLVTRGICSRRGLYILGGATLQSSDPLGLFSVRYEDAASATLLVLPPIVPLPGIDIHPGGALGDGRPRPNAPEQSVGAAGVREYQPGDPLKRIHWPTTARLGKPFVRTFDGTPASNWWIVLDLDSAAQVGQGYDSTEEHGVILAASLIDRALRSRQPVGLAINGHKPAWFPPKEGEQQRFALMYALALAQTGDFSLAEFVSRNERAFGMGSSLIIITASSSPDWLKALPQLAWRGIVPTVLLLDPLTFGGAANPAPLAARCAQMGIACHVIPRELLDRPEARPGHSGEWEWRTSFTGKAIATQKPSGAEWRPLV
jgi:uncharacterized protein (DUF58 family)